MERKKERKSGNEFEIWKKNIQRYILLLKCVSFK